MSSIDHITLPDGTSYELGDFEHYIKNSNYGIEDYEPNKRYRKNQVVWYKGDLFQSVDDNNRGNTPSHDSHYWMGPSIGAYSFWKEQAYSLCRNDFDIWTDTQYFIGDLVNYNGVIYEFTDNCKTRNWQDAEDYTRVFLGIQEGQDRDDDHNHIKWADKLLFDINITDSKIVQFDSKNSYSSGTLVKNKSGRIMKLTADYTANDPSTFSAYNATIDEILQVLLDNGGDLPSYIDIPDFDPYYAYRAGEYCKHDGYMYICISDVTKPDAWQVVSSHFTSTTLPDEVKDASNNAADAKKDTDFIKDFIGLSKFDESSTYGVGQFVIYNNSIFRCIKAHTGAWSSQDFVQYVLSPELQSFRIKTAGFSSSISQDLYNPNRTYNAGDYVFYNSDSVTGEYSLYKCTGTNVTGTWDSSKWTKVYILDELKARVGSSDFSYRSESTTSGSTLMALSSALDITVMCKFSEVISGEKHTYSCILGAPYIASDEEVHISTIVPLNNDLSRSGNNFSIAKNPKYGVMIDISKSSDSQMSVSATLMQCTSSDTDNIIYTFKDMSSDQKFDMTIIQSNL